MPLLQIQRNAVDDTKHWDDAVLNWSVGDTIKVRLTEQQTPATRVGFFDDAYAAPEVSTSTGLAHTETLHVIVNPPLDVDSYVTVRILDSSTATEGEDYVTSLPGFPGNPRLKLMKLPKGQGEVTFRIRLKVDWKVDIKEEIHLSLQPIHDGPYRVVDVDENGRYEETEVVILDNSYPIPPEADPRRGINVRPVFARLTEGESIEYIVELKSIPTDIVTLRPSQLNNAPNPYLHVTPSSVVFTPERWYERKTFTVTAPAGNYDTTRRHTIMHGLWSDDSNYYTGEWFKGPGIDGATHIRIEVRDAQSVEPSPQERYAGLVAQMHQWRNDPQWVSYKAHTDRWDRALLAFGVTVADTTLTPMTAAQAQALADKSWGTRWVPVAVALWEIEGNYIVD